MFPTCAAWLNLIYDFFPSSLGHSITDLRWTVNL